MNKIKISVVSYLNTIPFIYGISHSEFLKKNAIIELDYPAICAEKLLSNKVDIGLVPVVTIPKLSYYEILTDYCIGANGAVESVLLVGNSALQDIEKIFLDYQSRTSVQLVKILSKHFWKISPQMLPAENDYLNKISGTTSGLVIGDRAFGVKQQYPFVYDLAHEWKKFTNLPMVFACWIANKKIPTEFKTAFNKATALGCRNIQEVVNKTIRAKNPQINLERYLTKSIDFEFNEDKQKALQLFLSLVGK